MLPVTSAFAGHFRQSLDDLAQSAYLLELCFALIERSPDLSVWFAGFLMLPMTSALAWQPPPSLEAPAKLLLRLVTSQALGKASAAAPQPASSEKPAITPLRTRAALVLQTEAMLTDMWSGPTGNQNPTNLRRQCNLAQRADCDTPEMP